ncbi:MAG: universal stress protein, partial [Sphingomonadales bacterium]
MGIRSILVPVTAEPVHLPAVRLAAWLAVRLGARLRALHIRPDPRSSIPFIGEGLTAEVIHDLCQAGEREGKAAALAARAAFDEVVEEEGLTEATDATGPGFVFEEEVGFFADRLGRVARLADLTVVPQPGGASSEDSNEFLNEVLFGSGRPLLMAPSELGRTSMENVLVAWNGRA